LRRPQEGGFPYLLPSDRSGLPLSLPIYRVRIRLVLVPPDAEADYRPEEVDYLRRIEAIVDTGAPLTTFGFTHWAPFADELRWLPQPPTASGEPRRLTILGGRWTYRLAQVRLAATDGDRRWLPAAWTPVLCLDANPTTDNLALLGLRTPLLERRRLRHSGNTPDDLPIWWLEDDAGG
jgi:hypothetical protein